MQRLLENLFSSPINLREEVRLGAVQCDEPVATVWCRADDEFVLIQEGPGLMDVGGSQIRTIGTDNRDFGGAGIKRGSDGVIEASAKVLSLLWSEFPV